MQDTKLPRRQYTEEFKAEAVRLGESIGGHEAARRLGIPVATLELEAATNGCRGRWGYHVGSRSERCILADASPGERTGGREQPASQGACRRKAGRGNPSKSDGVLCQRVAMKYAWIDQHRDQYTVSRLCRVLAVSRSGYCQWRVRAPSARALANQALDAKVAVIHRDSRRSYGRPRIVGHLRQQGECVSAERVRQSLQRQGLRPVYRRAHVITTDSAHRLPVAPNLLDRRFDGWQLDQAWTSDITYIVTGEGWLYLAVVMDLASRRIVGWSMSEWIDATLVCKALRSAYWQRKPAAGLLVHSDRGSQYASHAYRRLTEDFAITMSMSRKGNAWDNAAMESFFKTLKVERIYQVRYDTRAQARLDIVDWIEGFYNRVRMHTAIGFVAPVTREVSLLAA